MSTVDRVSIWLLLVAQLVTTASLWSTDNRIEAIEKKIAQQATMERAK